MTSRKASTPPPARLRVPGVAFLLSQLGSHSSRLWQEQLAPLGLGPRHVVLLRHVAADEGRSQQALGEALQIPPSRMVALVDGLEQGGLLRRRLNPDDRRVRTVHLTREGRRQLVKVMEVSAKHERLLCAGLEPAEREQLIALLGRLAVEQGLAEGVHPAVADPDPDEKGAAS